MTRESILFIVIIVMVVIFSTSSVISLVSFIAFKTGFAARTIDCLSLRNYSDCHNTCGCSWCSYNYEHGICLSESTIRHCSGYVPDKNIDNCRIEKEKGLSILLLSLPTTIVSMVILLIMLCVDLRRNSRPQRSS